MRRGRIAASAGLVGCRLRLVVALALAWTAGCMPEPAFDHDPLLGGGPPLPRNGSPASSGAVAASGPASGPPQLPPPSGPVSPAALAAGSSPAADASALCLGPPPTNAGPAPGTLASVPSPGGAWHGTAANTAPVLKGPEPIADGTVKPIAVIAPPLAGPAPPPPGPAPPPPAVQGFSPRRRRRPSPTPMDSCKTSWPNGGSSTSS